MKRITLGLLCLTFTTTFSFAQSQNWQNVTLTTEIRQAFSKEMASVDFTMKKPIPESINKDKVKLFLGNRVDINKTIADVGIAARYGKDFPVSQFFREQYFAFMDVIADGVLTKSITRSEQLTDAYLKFIYATKKAIDNQQYDTNQKGSDHTPPPTKSLNGPCVNMDFEDGTTNGWELYDGQVDGTVQYSYTNNVAVGPGASHLIESSGNDPVCGFPMVMPGGNYSLRLGDGTGTNYGAAKLRQTFLVSPSNSNFSYSYALVLQSPAGHTAAQQPYFIARVFDENNNDISCGAYSVVASTGNQADFTVITVGGEQIWYKNWNTVFIPLQSYIGQNVTIEFTVGDCGQGGHYGYAYIDAACDASSFNTSANAICNGQPALLSAPLGAQSYSWNTGDTTQQISADTAGTYTCLVTPVTGPACAVTLSIDLTVATLPTANFSLSPASICKGDSIAFVDSSTAISPSHISNWEWDFGDGITAPMDSGVVSGVTGTSGVYSSPYHTYNTSGNLTAQLIVETESGCKDTMNIPLTVSTGPAVNAGSDQTVCEGTQITLTATNATSYSWNNGVTNGQPFSADSTATYVVTGTDGIGCTNTDTLQVTTNPSPTVSAGIDKALCKGDTTSLTATGATTYTWNFGVQNGVTFTPDSTLSYIVTGTTSGCTDSDTVTVTVNPIPNIVGNDTAVCQGVPITLHGSGGAVYAWTNGVQNGVSFMPTLGTTTYIVTGTDANSCVNADTVTVVVSTPPTAVVSATPTHGTKPLEVSFANGSSGAVTYSWDFGNGNSQTVSDTEGFEQTYTTEGDYTIILTANNNGCIDTAMVIVTVDPFGPVSFNAPNIVTPNGDGQNDIFHMSLVNAASLELKIFNRWGNWIQTITDINNQNGWNGKTAHGQDVDEGTYFYTYVIVGLNGDTFEGHGFVQVVRK